MFVEEEVVAAGDDRRWDAVLVELPFTVRDQYAGGELPGIAPDARELDEVDDGEVDNEIGAVPLRGEVAVTVVVVELLAVVLLERCHPYPPVPDPD